MIEKLHCQLRKIYYLIKLAIFYGQVVALILHTVIYLLFSPNYW